MRKKSRADSKEKSKGKNQKSEVKFEEKVDQDVDDKKEDKFSLYLLLQIGREATTDQIVNLQIKLEKTIQKVSLEIPSR